MHTVELLEEALQLAQSLGITVRQEALGSSGGSCEIKGQRWLFVDLTLSPIEQLEQAVDAIRTAPSANIFSMSPELRRLLNPRKAA